METTATFFISSISFVFGFVMSGSLDADVLLSLEDFESVGVVVGSYHDLDEDLRDFLGGRGVDLLVRGDDSAEDRDGVGFVRLHVGLVDGLSDAYSAGVRVLDGDDTRGLVAEFLEAVERAVRVIYIIVGKFLAVELLSRREGAGELVADLAVEGAALVRWFSP